MSSPTGTEAPAAAWPSDTYFTEEWALFVNGEALQLIHVPDAHSDGDTIVFFRRSDVISTGDIYRRRAIRVSTRSRAAASPESSKA